MPLSHTPGGVRGNRLKISKWNYCFFLYFRPKIRWLFVWTLLRRCCYRVKKAGGVPTCPSSNHPLCSLNCQGWSESSFYSPGGSPNTRLRCHLSWTWRQVWCYCSSFACLFVFTICMGLLNNVDLQFRGKKKLINSYHNFQYEIWLNVCINFIPNTSSKQ